MTDPRNQEIYISVDLETDGPTPAKNSMLSLGAVAYTADGKELGNFYKKLEPLPGHEANPNTMKWWNEPEQQAAWEEAIRDPQDPKAVMQDFSDWVRAFSGKPVLVAYPVAFESMWLQYYFAHFDAENPLGFNGIDVRSYAMACLNSSYKQAGKEQFPQDWISDYPMTHKAHDDARNQGDSFIKMLKWRNKQELVEASRSVGH